MFLLIFRSIVNAISGFANAFMVPACAVMLGSWAPPHDRTKLSAYFFQYFIRLTFSGSALGIALGSPIAGAISDNLGWEYVYYIDCSIGIVVFILYVMYV